MGLSVEKVRKQENRGKERSETKVKMRRGCQRKTDVLLNQVKDTVCKCGVEASLNNSTISSLALGMATYVLNLDREASPTISG